MMVVLTMMTLLMLKEIPLVELRRIVVLLPLFSWHNKHAMLQKHHWQHTSFVHRSILVMTNYSSEFLDSFDIDDEGQWQQLVHTDGLMIPKRCK
jgi:hypothetical protein